MTSAAAVLIYRPSPRGFGGTGDTGKLSWGSSWPAGFAAGVSVFLSDAEGSADTFFAAVDIVYLEWVRWKLGFEDIRARMRGGSEERRGWW